MKYIYMFIEKERSINYGRGTYIQQLIKCFQNSNGISFNVIEFFSEAIELKVKEENNVRIYSFPNVYIPSALLFKYFRNCWCILKSHINTTENDRLIFHLNFLQELELIKYMRADFPKSKIIFTLHFQQWTSILLGNFSYYKRIIKDEINSSTLLESDIKNNFNFEKRMYDKLDQIVVLSKFTEELLIKYYEVPKKKIKLIYNGFTNDGTHILKKVDVQELRNHFFVDKEKIILFVGRLDQSKGLNILIEAFKKVLKSISNCRLIVVGEGNFTEYIKMASYSRNKITFSGMLDKEDLYKYYQIADLGVIPSFHEQCSFVAIEMMKFGLPILSSSANGLFEMINTYEGGTIIDLEESGVNMMIDSDILSEKIISILSEKNQQKFKISKKYTFNNFCKQYIKLYSEV
jgi:glycosyltransferase